MKIPDFQLSRRKAMEALAGFLAASPLLEAQQDPFREHARVPGLYELETTFEFEPVAFGKITRSAYDYSSYGAGGEFTLRRNREAFEWVDLVPDALGGGEVQTATTLFGSTAYSTPLQYPIMIAPTAFQGQLNPDAESATHKAATAVSRTPMILSYNATQSFETVAKAAEGPMWWQLYPRQQIDSNREILEQVQALGARAIVVTVDQQASTYERQLHDRNLTAVQRPSNQAVPPASPNTPYRLSPQRLWYTWDFFDKIRPWIKVPMLIKGILTAEDARLAIEHGCDGVYVSNHGGRSLDYGPSTLEVLPEIADAVGGQVPVLFDSGIRRGADILKALALGANAVCIGRPVRWGLAAYGQPGVQRVLEILQAELRLAMQQAGRTELARVDRTLVRADFR